MANDLFKDTVLFKNRTLPAWLFYSITPKKVAISPAARFDFVHARDNQACKVQLHSNSSTIQTLITFLTQNHTEGKRVTDSGFFPLYLIFPLRFCVKTLIFWINAPLISHPFSHYPSTQSANANVI